MEPININELQRFVGATVEITIHDNQGGDQAPAVSKKIKKVQHCPDGTHIRFYFDHVYFLAVPLTSDTVQTDKMFSAFDTESGLTYTFNMI